MDLRREGAGVSRGVPGSPGLPTKGVSLSSEGLCPPGLHGTADGALLIRKDPQPGAWPIPGL